MEEALQLRQPAEVNSDMWQIQVFNQVQGACFGKWMLAPKDMLFLDLGNTHITGLYPQFLTQQVWRGARKSAFLTKFPHVLVSCWYYNKSLQIWWLNTTHSLSYSSGGQKFEILLIGLKSRCWQSYNPCGSSERRIHFFAFSILQRLSAFFGMWLLLSSSKLTLQFLQISD